MVTYTLVLLPWCCYPPCCASCPAAAAAAVAAAVAGPQVYGFTCSCPRCLLEGSPEWQEAQQDGDSNEGWETDSGSGDVDLDTASPLPAAGGMQEDGSTHHHHHDHNHQQPGQQQQQEPMEAGYLSVFLLKYMCPKDGCYGTMAAVHGSAEGLCECSVCGALRSEAEFMAELEGQQ